nr:hypothetical protein BdHM001_35240 [Bdellovibrio sp. HM001]
MNPQEYVQNPSMEQIEKIMMKFRDKRYSISDDLYQRLKAAWEVCEDRDGLLHPDEARHSWVFIMSELLGQVVEKVYKGDPERQRASFGDMFSVALRGENPLSKTHIQQAGIDGQFWIYACRQAVGEDAMRPLPI